MPTPTTLLELDILEETSIMRLTQPEPSYWVTLISCTKLLLAIALKRKSGVPLGSASCPSTSSAKEKHHMHIMLHVSSSSSPSRYPSYPPRRCILAQQAWDFPSSFERGTRAYRGRSR